jgi:hypothetical protein
MAIRRFSTASISTGNSKSTKLWDQETFQSGMFALATVSLTSTASSVVFSDIPSSYTHLQVRILERGLFNSYSQAGLRVRVNGDTGSNYSWHVLRGVGSSALAEASANDSVMGLSEQVQAGATANVFSGLIVDILDYANTNKNKTIRTLGGYDANGSGNIALTSGNWRSANAVTSLTFAYVGLPDEGFAVNSHFALYGIRTA